MIVDIILEKASGQPQKIAISHGESNLTYAELAAKVKEISATISKHRKYLIDSISPIEAIVNLLACQRSGCVGMITHADITTADKNYLLATGGFTSFEKRTHEEQNIVSQTSQNFFLGVLTSGSTASPKVIYKDNDCWESAFQHQSEVFGISDSDNILVLDAIAYSANLNSILHGLWVGATVTLCSLSKSRRWSELIVNQCITSIFMVPSHLNLLRGTILPMTVKSIVTAGEKLQKTLASSILQNSPGVILTEYYGTAELGHITYHQNNEIISNPLSVGRAFPDVKISILDNQLYVESPYVSPEFKRVKTVGDLGIWEEGKLILLGRAGKMFNRRGLNIFAQEIEQKALSYPTVNEAYLVEICRNKNQRLVLFYSIHNQSLGSQQSANDLSKYLKALLPLAKRPNHLIELERLPRLSNGKVDEKGLKLMVNYVDEDVYS